MEESLRKGANTLQDGQDPRDKVTRINDYCHDDYCHDDIVTMIIVTMILSQ